MTPARSSESTDRRLDDAALARPIAVAPLLPRQAARCLRYIAGHPGASSADVQMGVGIRHASQVSNVLLRLERDGLTRTDRGQRMLNAWEVTGTGAELLSQLPEGIYE
jgi:hypothetical protein